jgi:hypothetical protein
MPICHRVLIALAIALVLTVGIPSVASATDFFCGSGDVGCVIRSIESANAGRGRDTIILEAGTYPLTDVDNTVDSDPFGGNGLPSITGRITIQGAGADATILDGSGHLRLLHIAASGRVTLQGLTMLGGNHRASGGAILNRGHLTVSQAVIRDNLIPGAVGGEGGGIFSEGTLRVVDSQILHNSAHLGNGIWSVGTLHVVRSTIAQNFSGDAAGGLFASGTTTIRDSAITHNSAGFSVGGGLAVSGDITITNTTIALNGAPVGGGLRVSTLPTGQAIVRLTNVTIADNRSSDGGGGLRVEAGATVLLQNTIIARNTDFGAPNPPDCASDGALTSLGNNIIGNVDGCAIDLAPTDFVGDAGLGAFEDDGTPGNGHIPLTALSPAINSANAEACPARDQLGLSRHRRRGCDIGAVEFQP